MVAVEKAARGRLHGPVRVTISARAAYSPRALKRSIADLMERMGCPRCFSGADCLFSVERDLTVNARLGLDAVALNPQPLPPRESQVTVSFAPRVRYDIAKIFKAVDRVIDLLGPCPCHSGFDVQYLNELKVIGVNEKLEAQQFGG